MSHRRLAAWVSVIAIGWLTPGASAQAPGSTEPVADHTVPRTADGRPDLTGFWTTQTFTPMERPDYLGDKAFYTEEEWTQLQAQLTVEGADPLARSVITIADPEERARVLDQTHRDETYVHYDNAIWLATRVPKGLSTRRTSLVTDPPDGRIPPRNDAAQARAAARRAERGDRGAFDGYELRPLSERCIAYGYNGPPLQPPAYNDIHQFFQTPDHVVIFTEQNNNPPRIVPLDGRPVISDKIRMYPGDSRGRWEGDTLVVESSHFNDETAWQGSSRHLTVVERFTRVSADRIQYTFTVEDPNTWDQPWSAEIPMMATEGPMFEYACHEGNHDLRHILEVYRNIERQEAASQ
ncbi:MAG: hypothetical protein QF681_18350 [Vicinamibacterales bacterium]|jgi:hypothetical protein|nr:hypothetical protein [Vicinamibacterales bacterium]